ncbi:phosphoribosylformylglycinamidine cyclo-ligase [Synergistes jonesii]|uniref:Phosphoribosylformylglycinamidine cyclo-ligase n=1 Tax=Synergistes jonesii TaxID=2754 RepID=A0A073IR61_9BACT|nr:phosphoribosylformylglycinamidine cyclo-ligase [Synergistes jonesii]KEJ91961.1 phosphoribosylaminoimidazole synthetase [Synergistes jonesii]OFB61911.1 phosphoribosylaminoimidazole synthetase [Synergistes jonesii]OFB62240.1 phosphoribosylaminoimidazole synthetase [Synergistes jonesii]OFB62969.1 phosphoribosylaminoimidazole synthetase [Synergistes jonesii]OFB67475.1 phosphoribosylaminoimidazole synthetase [Synergistes jonesii]
MGKLSYEKSGVSISGGDAWVETIKGLLAKRPKDKNCLGGVGGFAGLYRIGGGQCLAACCDGVGTKLELAKATGLYRGLGQDLVAMNVNDLVTVGARPLFFLDYAACGKLNESILKEIVQGVIDACGESLCTLLGGETAEMPGVYDSDGFDLAGFSVGIVEEEKIIDGSGIQEGDLLIGLPSSGIHSNGYSLVRSALGKEGLDVALDSLPTGWQETVGEAVMRPTKLYVKAALAAASTGKVRGMAHITGGGMLGNVIRVIPKHLDVAVDFLSWRRPAVFDLIQSAGIEEEEMRRVFNLGIGFVFIAAPDDLKEIEKSLEALGEEPAVIGEVIKCTSRA